MSTVSKRLLRLPDVIERTGLSRSELYRRVKGQAFPKPIRIGARMVAWVEGDIDRWIADCVARGRAANACSPE